MVTLFYLFFIAIYTAKMLGFYDGQKQFYAFVALGLIFYVLKLLTTKMSLLEYAIVFILMGMAGIVYLSSGEKGLLLYMAVLTAMKGVDYRKVLKLALFTGGVIYAVMVILTSLGIITDGYHLTGKFGSFLLMRRYFGQPGSNVTHTVLFVLISLALFMYGNGKRLEVLSLLFMLVNVYFFSYTLSVTGVLSVTVLLVVNLIVRKIPTVNTVFLKLVANILFTFVVITSIVLPVLAKGHVYDFFNKILNHRIEYGQYFLTNESLSLFGSRFAPAPNANYYLDNAFLYLYLQLGIVTFITVMVLYYFTLNMILRDNNKGALVIFTANTFIGLSDPFLFNTSFRNVIFVFAGFYFYKAFEELNNRFGLKQYCLLRFKSNLDFDNVIARATTSLKAVMAFFEQHTAFVLGLFIVLPMCGLLIFLTFPRLYDISLFATGDRLCYAIEYAINLNKDVNLRCCALRTGILDGAVLATVITLVKVWMTNKNDRKFTNNKQVR